MYDWEPTEYEQIERSRSEFRRLGLYIFESFEEYMKDREEDEE